MDETTKKLLNPTQTILDKMPLIIEAFVKFYGEEEREKIKTKFTNMVIIGYHSPTNFKSIIESAEKVIHQDEEKYQNEIRPYKQYQEIISKTQKEAHIKYPQKIFESLKGLFNKEEYEEIINRDFALEGYNINRINQKIENFISYKSGDPLIQSFGIEETIKLKFGTKWQKESIEKDRIKYFNNLGINLGNNYQNYKKDKNSKKITPSVTMVNIFEKNRIQIREKIEEECQLPYYNENREKIDKLNLLDKDDGYSTQIHKEGNKCCVNPNVKIINGKYVEYPVVLIPIIPEISRKGGYLDGSIIHELNHVYELKLKNIDIEKGIYTYVSGFDNIEEGIPRKYTLLSEIINELISQEISEILSQFDIYIFDSKETKRLKGMSTYEEYRYLVEEFYQTYKKEIIESRKQGDIQILYNAIGEENLEQLNQIIIEFMERIYPRIHKINNNIEKNIKLGSSLETEKNKRIMLMIEEIENAKKILQIKKDDILLKMYNHHQSNTKKL